MSNLTSLDSKPSPAPGPKSPQEIIGTFLNYLQNVRSEVFLDFTHKSGMTYQRKAICTAYNKESIRFCLCDKGTYTPTKQREFTCFFVLKKNNKELPCNFQSTVIDIIEKGVGTHIDVVFPEKITHQQRRNGVRIPRTKADIPDFCLWTSGTIFEDNSENSIKWHSVDPKAYDIIDMSTGGMMLSVSRASPLSKKIRKDFTVLCTGKFYNADKVEQQFSLLGKVRRIVLDNKNNADKIGIEFIKWVKAPDSNNG